MDVGLGCAVAVLSWHMFHSWLRGEFWWAKLNVAGAVFYGSEVYSMGLGRATLAGFALLFVLYCLLGIGFSLFARTRGFTRNVILACLWMLSWQILSQRFFWRALDAFGPSYYPLLATLPGHLLAALSLSRFATRFQSLALTFGDSCWSKSYEPPAEFDPAVSAADGQSSPESLPDSASRMPQAADNHPSTVHSSEEAGAPDIAGNTEPAAPPPTVVREQTDLIPPKGEGAGDC